MNVLNPMREKEIITFSATIIALSSMICFVSYKLGDANISILAVFTPSFVALILTAMSKGKNGVYELFVKQSIQKTAFKWFLISLIGIPILVVLAVLTSLSFDIIRFDLRTTQLLPQIIVIVFIAIGKEYGWRGFLLPRLMNTFNVFNSSIILGLLWGFWHFPAYLIGTGVPLQMDFMVFLIWVVLGTLFISWIYYYTKSVLTSILAHLSANAAFNYLPILPEFAGNMIGFWIFIVYLAVLLIIIYSLRRKDLLDG